MNEVLVLTQELIRRVSVTPDDAGCQPLIADRLQRAGFHCESLRFGVVDNLWALHGPLDGNDSGPVLVLLGHTDVVPPGPREGWSSDPFVPEESTGGGTSDARFIAPLGAHCVEIGPVNASIHKVDEHVAVADLEALPDLYLALLERLLAG